jgi:hypothetical protein
LPKKLIGKKDERCVIELSGMAWQSGTYVCAAIQSTIEGECRPVASNQWLVLLFFWRDKKSAEAHAKMSRGEDVDVVGAAAFQAIEEKPDFLTGGLPSVKVADSSLNAHFCSPTKCQFEVRYR